MITEVGIQNYKSISDLKLELGRVTVLIGENGSGKSNILEAIALGSAAAGDKLDNEFLAPRGIRVPSDPRFMRAAFDKESVCQDIVVSFDHTDCPEAVINLAHDNKPLSKWAWSSPVYGFSQQDLDSKLQELKALGKWADGDIIGKDILNTLLLNRPVFEDLSDFLIYSPEYSSLKKQQTEGTLRPLGRLGEELIPYLHDLASLGNEWRLKDVKERMQFLEWFQDFKTSKGFADHVSLEIQDNFISAEVGAFDQLSANEGFLFILFYFCLLVGAETPRFFAIDNVDTSLNPKLCMRLVIEMAILAKKYDKQVILTTHNPAILDGLNLDDDEQRLFVVRRNLDGQTVLKRILKPKAEEGAEPVRLSEAFLRGYIGGLPRNF